MKIKSNVKFTRRKLKADPDASYSNFHYFISMFGIYESHCDYSLTGS